MSNINNTNTILKVRPADSSEWIDIPSIRGTSVYSLGAPSPISRQVVIDDRTITQRGYVYTVYDEKKAITTPSYTGDTLTIWDGLSGAGAVNTVDEIGVDDGTVNVTLGAVSYTRIQDELRSNQTAQNIARTNINALQEPSTKILNGFIQFTGDPSEPWTTTHATGVPSGGLENMILYKTSDENYACGWSNFSLSSSDIDSIINDL